MRKTALTSLFLLAFSIFLLSSCVSTQVLSTEEINIPQNSVFYVDASNDDLYVYQSVMNMIEKHGFKSQMVTDISQIPSATGTISSGSGFFISPSIILTNAHVVDGCKEVKIIKNGEEYSAEVFFVNDSNDIALLKTEEFDTPCFRIAKAEEYAVTDSIFALGYPLTDILGTEIRVTNGIINSLSGINGDSNVMQISAQIQPGNSGGPVINDSFAVVGMASSKLSDSYSIASKNTIAQNVNFAIKGEILSLFCDSYLADSTDMKIVDSIQDAMSATVMIISEEENITTDKYYYISFGYKAEYDVVHWTATHMNMSCYDVESGEELAFISKDYFSVSDIYDIAKSQILYILKQLK